MIIFITIGCVMIGLFSIYITGSTIHDLKRIAVERQFARHPHARIWRKKPYVSVVANHDVDIMTLRKDYKKIASAKSHISNDQLILFLPDGSLPTQGTVADAVRHMQATDIKCVELPVELAAATSLRSLMSNYLAISTFAFASMRSGLKIIPTSSQWPVVMRPDSLDTRNASWAYSVLQWMASTIRLLFISYVTYLSIFLQQSQLLFICLACVGLWAVWSIITYPALATTRRLGYIAVLPATFFYFLFRIIAVPFLSGMTVVRNAQNARVVS